MRTECALQSEKKLKKINFLLYFYLKIYYNNYIIKNNNNNKIKD